jgi:alpha-amylase/alpha-mannosidase (GH57 family)
MRLPVVLLWHMHQPQYRDALTGQYVLPWTYLHAIKDYTDMAAQLESIPAALRSSSSSWRRSRSA